MRKPRFGIFRNLLEEYLFDYSRSTCLSEYHTEDRNGNHHWLLIGPVRAGDIEQELKVELTPGEATILANSRAGIIVTQEKTGRVRVRYFSDPVALDREITKCGF